MKIKAFILTTFSFCSLLFASCEEKNPEMEISSRLQDVSRLELARMTVSKVGLISDHKYEKATSVAEKTQALIDAMKIGNRIGVYSYDTYIVAYIDMSGISADDVVFNKNRNEIQVTLPPVEVITDGREPRLHEEHYRVTGMRSSIKPEERAALKAQMAAEVKKEMANDTGAKEILKKEAKRKAMAWFSNIIEEWGYNPVITIKD